MRTILSLILSLVLFSCNGQGTLSNEKKEKITAAIQQKISHTGNGKTRNIRNLKIVKIEPLTEKEYMKLKLERYMERATSSEEHLVFREDVVSTTKHDLEKYPGIEKQGALDSAIANKLIAEQELSKARYSLDSFQKIVNNSTHQPYGYMVSVTYDILSYDGKPDSDKDKVMQYMVTNEMKVSAYYPPFKP